MELISSTAIEKLIPDEDENAVSTRQKPATAIKTFICCHDLIAVGSILAVEFSGGRVAAISTE